MTDEGQRAVEDLAAEIMSADRLSAPAKDEARSRARQDYLIRVWLVITVVAFILTPLIVVILSRPD